MNINKDLSFVTATRLKSLRQARGLSHERLSKEISNRYQVKISSDSLMNYEVTDQFHSNALKNQGMRIEYLRCLSDFYGVSSDYILGISDIKPSDITAQAVIDYTGLTDDCVIALHTMHEDDLAQDYTCSDVGSNKPILDFFSDILDDFFTDHRLIATYYIALRRKTTNGGKWYSNNANGRTSECDQISPDFSCMKIAREVEKALRRKYRVKQDGAAAGYHKEFIMDHDEERVIHDSEEDD